MALSRHHAATSRPLTVEEVVRQAQDFEFGPNRSLKNWLRSAQMLLTEAAICEQDGNLQTAYLYLYRHAELVLARFPQHPEYKDPKYKQDLQQARKTVQKNLPKLEQWKPRINQQYQRYVKAMERRNLERQRVEDERLPHALANDVRRSSADSEDGSLQAWADLRQSLSAIENSQLAVDLANSEIRRRDASKRSTLRAGLSPDTVAERRRGVVVNTSDIMDEAHRGHHPHFGKAGDGVNDISQHTPAQRASSLRQSRQADPPPGQPASTSYNYPSVPARHQTTAWKQPAPQPSPYSAPQTLPTRPAKEALDYRPKLQEDSAPVIPPRPQDQTSNIPSPPDIATETSKYTFKPTAYTESGSPLRTVLLPPELRTAFLNLAHTNTTRNLETCGILCGTLISNALFISHLVVPDQTSTSDTCDTTESGDNALFDYCDSHDLLVCGWIHTHPQQTCFMSSRDVHTSAGYQVMLPEAIAIVCAPRHNPDWGIFRLTDPPGLEHVLSCTQAGVFHPHAEKNLYTDALRPGHVVEGPGLKFEVVDLRKG